MKAPVQHRSGFSSKTMAAARAAVAFLALAASGSALAEQPPPPCHPNPHALFDRAIVHLRGDVRNLPRRLRERLERLAERPHTYLPMQAFAEADKPSQLFQYYLLDTTGFEANPFTARFPGINANGLPWLLGIQLHDQLDPPAV